MTNLVPEKRVDKNGVLTTKHVRADTTPVPNRDSLPAPSLENPLVTPTPSQRQKRFRVNKKKWDCDETLAYTLHAHFSPTQTFECSDADAYDVLGAVAPHNVIPLLSIGIRTSAEAREFLNQNELTHLNEDYSEMASEVMGRGYNSTEFLEFATAYKDSIHLSTFMDAVEAHFDRDLQAADKKDGYNLRNSSLEDMIIKGEVRLSDIREIGSDFILENASSQKVIYRHLALLAKQQTEIKSASEIKKIIEDAKWGSVNTTPALDLASVYGAVIPREARGSRIMQSWKLAMTLQGLGRGAEENKKIFHYSMQLPDTTQHEETIALFDAGVSGEIANRGLEAGLTIEQMIAISQKTVTPNLATGVL